MKKFLIFLILIGSVISCQKEDGNLSPSAGTNLQIKARTTVEEVYQTSLYAVLDEIYSPIYALGSGVSSITSTEDWVYYLSHHGVNLTTVAGLLDDLATAHNELLHTESQGYIDSLSSATITEFLDNNDDLPTSLPCLEELIAADQTAFVNFAIELSVAMLEGGSGILNAFISLGVHLTLNRVEFYACVHH